MSDSMQPRATRQPRERITTSCGECRRRKQKCSQGQPCTNCARRFPQPVCEYKPTRRRNPPGVSSHPTFTVTLRSAADKDPGAQEPLLDVPEPGWMKARGGRGHGLAHGGEVATWSGINMTTQYPSTVSLERLVHTSSSPPPLPSKPLDDVTLCDDNCNKHSQAVHDAMRLIFYRISIPDKFLLPWSSYATVGVEQVMAWQAAVNPGPIAWRGVTNDFESLPMVPSKQNSDLLKIFLKLLCRYKASLDGNPDPNNPIVKFYYPFCIQDPLLLQIILYTSACFLNETGHLSRMGVIAHKGKAIHMLNEQLRSQSHQTGDAVIAGVVQLIVDEWYWGDTDDLKAHMRGLREMIRIRGGFYNLGMDGLLAKLVVTHDIGIALAHEIKPYLGDGAEFEYEDRTAVPFRVSHNTPFMADLPSFKDSANALGLHTKTAWILDSMRFLINAVVNVPESNPAADLHKIATTSEWLYEQIRKLPEDSPDGNRVVDDSDISFPATIVDGDGLARAVDESKAVGKAPSARSSDAGIVVDFLLPDSPREVNLAEGESFNTPSNAHSDVNTALARISATSTPTPRDPRDHRDQKREEEEEEEAATPDFMYRAIRSTAILMVRAIRDRKPLSKACTREEFLQIWTTCWRVPLTRWRSVLGIFNWAMLAIVPSCHGGAHERFARTMYMISMLSRAVEDWRVTIGAARAAMKVQEWLAGGDTAGAPSAGGEAVLKYGLAYTKYW